jgi:hypothetical protein
LSASVASTTRTNVMAALISNHTHPPRALCTQALVGICRAKMCGIFRKRSPT